MSASVYTTQRPLNLTYSSDLCACCIVQRFSRLQVQSITNSLDTVLRSLRKIIIRLIDPLVDWIVIPHIFQLIGVVCFNCAPFPRLRISTVCFWTAIRDRIHAWKVGRPIDIVMSTIGAALAGLEVLCLAIHGITYPATGAEGAVAAFCAGIGTGKSNQQLKETRKC